jgi:hypothetical protein
VTVQPVVSSVSSHPYPELTPRFTREERIARYEQRKAEELVKLQKKGRAMSHQEDMAESTVTFVSDTPEESAAPLKRNIIGLDYQTVRSLLEEERISSVDADTVIKKLGHLVELANVNGKMLGKRISTDILSQSELEGEHINLRQVNWVVDGGVTQIRFYIEDMKQGYFVLRGIMSKKGESQQTRYIRQLLLRIVRERKEKE